MQLTQYNQKRDFKKTPEPRGSRSEQQGSIFVVQKHAASKLHYDFRLQIGGVLKSWAVPKGPSMDPRVKRLAVEVEDHPLSYGTFEGSIPEGNYGAGKVIVWDMGSLETGGGEAALLRMLKAGRLTFVLRGKKLHGVFSLVRFHGKRQWLLLKRHDKYETEEDPTEDSRSVLSRRTLPDPEPSSKKRQARSRAAYE